MSLLASVRQDTARVGIDSIVVTGVRAEDCRAVINAAIKILIVEHESSCVRKQWRDIGVVDAEDPRIWILPSPLDRVRKRSGP